MNNKKKLNNEQEQSLIKDYNQNILTKKEIQKKYGITPHLFQKTLKVNNIPPIRRSIDCGNKKYTYDTSFFKEIDSEEKAYFLGILMADGFISSKVNNWLIGLTMTDIDVIEKFQKALKTNAPIRTRNLSNAEVKRQDSHTLSINSKEMVADIAKTRNHA